jgi:hypothetical protein
MWHCPYILGQLYIHINDVILQPDPYYSEQTDTHSNKQWRSQQNSCINITIYD